MRVLFTNLLLVVAMAGCTQSSSAPSARTPSERAPGETAAPADSGRIIRNVPASDNTAVNRRDVEARTKTPIDQKRIRLT